MEPGVPVVVRAARPVPQRQVDPSPGIQAIAEDLIHDLGPLDQDQAELVPAVRPGLVRVILGVGQQRAWLAD